jgi:hypothetical protein
MIGVRVQCDTIGCARHFDLDAAIDLGPRAQLGPRQEPFVVFGVPFIALPADWAAVSPPDGPGLSVYCAEHAKA